MLADMTISSSIARLEAILNSQGPKIFCAEEQYEYLRILSGCIYFDTPCRAKIVTKRNDSRLNNHQRLQLQGWRANCDIQVVIDHYACVEYLIKYAAKGEPRSPMLKHL